MKCSELVRLIKKRGGRFKAHDTKHDLYINPETGQTAEVPRHPSHDIKTGTANAIIKALGFKKF